MNQVIIDIDKLLTEEEQKAIAKEIFKQQCERSAKSNFDKLILQEGSKLVEEQMLVLFREGEGFKTVLNDKIKSCIKTLDVAKLFQSMAGEQLLEEALALHTGFIKDEVKSWIKKDLSKDKTESLIVHAVGLAVLEYALSKREDY